MSYPTSSEPERINTFSEPELQSRLVIRGISLGDPAGCFSVEELHFECILWVMY